MRSVLGESRLIYMVRDPIDRMLSHYLHNVGGGYEHRGADRGASPTRESAYVARSRYAFQLEPYLDAFGPERIEIVTREELKGERPATMRRVFAFLGVDPELHLRAVRARVGDRDREGRRPLPAHGPGRPASRACGRSTATSTACPSRCAGWSSGSSTTRGAGEVPKPEVPAGLREWLDEPVPRRRGAARGARRPQLRLARLAALGEPPATHKLSAMRVSVAADELVGVAEAVVEELAAAATSRSPTARSADAERDDWAWASEAAARDVAEGRAEQAIVCCWTGTGASIAANKVAGRAGRAVRRRRDGRRRAQVERRQRPRAQPPRHLRRRARRDPRRLVRGRAQRRSATTAPTSPTWPRSRPLSSRLACAPCAACSPTPARPRSPTSCDDLDLVAEPADDRPYVITNFAITLDGRATLARALGRDRQRHRHRRCWSGCGPRSTR